MNTTRHDLPRPGHFIAAAYCRFFRAALINDRWLVSTVGDYWPRGSGSERETVGFGRLYETMVFRVAHPTCSECDPPCGMPIVEDWTDLEMAPANTEDDAILNHERLCREWATK